jgi:hypothetical protein
VCFGGASMLDEEGCFRLGETAAVSVDARPWIATLGEPLQHIAQMPLAGSHVAVVELISVERGGDRRSRL